MLLHIMLRVSQSSFLLDANSPRTRGKLTPRDQPYLEVNDEKSELDEKSQVASKMAVHNSETDLSENLLPPNVEKFVVKNVKTFKTVD